MIRFPAALASLLLIGTAATAWGAEPPAMAAPVPLRPPVAGVPSDIVGGQAEYQPPPPPPAFESQELAPPDPDGVGTLDVSTGGVLPATAWQGSTQPLAGNLVASLPAGIASPTLRRLTRQALLSAVPPPAGAPGNSRPWTARRLERVAAMGDAAAARELAALAPFALEDEAAARAFVGTELLLGNPDDICRQVPPLVVRHKTTDWQEFIVLCRRRANEDAAAALALDILREQADKGATFIRLADEATLGAKAPALKSLPDARPVEAALVVGANRAFPADAVARATPPVLLAIARSEQTAAAVRLAAAGRAARLGLIEARDLGQLYRQAKVADAKTGTLPRPGSTESQAALYQALMAAPDAAAKGEALRRAVEAAGAADLGGPYGELLASEAGILVPGPEQAALAPAAVKLLLLQNRADLARPWIELVQSGEAASALWPLIEVSGAAPRPGGAADWLAGLELEINPARREAAGTALAYLAAAKIAVDPAARAATLTTAAAAPAPGASAPPLPPAALFAALEEAGAARRLGETALLSVLVLDGRVPAGLLGVAAVRQLAAAGLETQARQLAVEAIAEIRFGP